MSDDFEVKGVEQFLKLSKALKEAGEKELRKELNKAIRDAVKPLHAKAGETLAAGLPGALADRGGKVKQVTKVRTGSEPGVTVGVQYGARGRGLGAANARLVNRTGQVRHPVFGNRDVWASTRTNGRGWFDNTYSSSAPEVRASIEQALENVAEQVVRKAG